MGTLLPAVGRDHGRSQGHTAAEPRGGPEVPHLSRNQLPRAQFGPFAQFFLEAFAAHHVPFHFNVPALLANVDINGGLHSFKAGELREVGLLVLPFYSVVGGAAVNVVAIYANAHIARVYPPKGDYFLIFYSSFVNALG